MVITLPDGKILEFSSPIAVGAIAASIGAGLAKAAIAGEVDDQLVDTSHLVSSDARVRIITAADAVGLDILRHSTSHLLAHAVKELYPAAQLVIGPTIEDGFYYDFYYPQGFSEHDLEAIEKKMHEIATRAHPLERLTMSREEAVKFFADAGEKYKVELIAAIPQGEPITLYRQGDFVDLCRGPHVPNLKFLQAFKLTKVAGAYWRGDSNNEVLQRIYGTAWPDKKALAAYLERLEQAKLRDHRVLAQKLDLLHLQPEAPGLIFWHANGWNIYKEIKQYLSKRLVEFDYQEICTPQLLDSSLWEKSGHWDKYHNNMFVTESEKHLYALKPMNCPGHIQVFKQGLKSYRDLPIRYAEFGSCHRNEHSGTLHGLFRVRGFVQDDGHILCTENQVAAEAAVYMDQLYAVYKDFGFSGSQNIIIKLATRPEKRIGADEQWERAERLLAEVLNSKKLAWEYNPGEGAFYGPKIEVSLRDCLHRVWQCGTLQLDFCMPERLGAYYIDESGNKKTPVMLHRAMLGSIERFIGIMLEHTAGDLPLWLAPVQVVVMNITDAQSEYAQKIAQSLKQRNVRVNLDLRNEKISYKIREHSMRRVPYQVIVGNDEMAAGMVAVRARDGKDLGKMSIDELNKIMCRGAVLAP